MNFRHIGLSTVLHIQLILSSLFEYVNNIRRRNNRPIINHVTFPFPITCFVTNANFLLSSLSSDILSLCSLSKLRDQVSHLHKAKVNIMVSHTLIFTYFKGDGKIKYLEMNFMKHSSNLICLCFFVDVIWICYYRSQMPEIYDILDKYIFFCFYNTMLSLFRWIYMSTNQYTVFSVFICRSNTLLASNKVCVLPDNIRLSAFLNRRTNLTKNVFKNLA